MKENNSNQILSKFTNLYPIQKTLRFSLKPMGRTEEMIKKKNILVQDEELSKKYTLAKKIIDEYHKYFINKRLQNFVFKLEDLSEYENFYQQLKQNQQDDNLKKKNRESQEKLRKQVASGLGNKNIFKRLFGDKLITEDLPKWLESNTIQIMDANDPKAIIQEFKKRTTYFKGFHTNRKNIYSKEEHPATISYRIVHENLPKFIDNLNRFKLARKLDIDFSEIEDKFDVKLDKIFTLGYFNQCLNQPGIDFYNKLRGGTGKRGDQEEGINEKINLFTQQLQNRLTKTDYKSTEKIKKQIKQARSCKLEVLYKQILTDRSQIFFNLKHIQNDGELVQQIEDLFFFQNTKFMGVIEIQDKETQKEKMVHYNIEEELRKWLGYLEQANPTQVYLRNNYSLTKISKHLFGDWSIIKKCLAQFCAKENLGFNKKGKNKKLTVKEQEKWLNKKFFSILEIHNSLSKYGVEYIVDETLLDKAQGEPLYDYFRAVQGKVNNEKNEEVEIDFFNEIKMAFQQVEPILASYRGKQDESLRNNKEEVKKIKKYLDAIQDLFYFIKPLELRFFEKDMLFDEAFEKDSDFYINFDEAIHCLKNIIPLYNHVQNYLTRKPYSTEKYKLNFENSILADGWDKNNEVSNACLIFRKDNLYYLGIMDKKHNKLFSKEFDQSGECYEKMVYKFIPNPYKMLPKVFFSSENADYYSPSKKILSIRNTSSYTKNGTPKNKYDKAEFNIKDMHEMIDFYKESIGRHKDWESFQFKFSPTDQYQNIKDFYREVEHQSYKISFTKVSKSYIDRSVEQGYLYLFQIYSKDFSTNRNPEVKEKKQVNENLHTMYWKALFDEKNIKNVTYKLNGKAEIFFRKSSIKYDEKIWKEGHYRNDPQKKQPYPIIKDRRYAKDTYLFHVPITLNFKASKSSNMINPKVNQFLKNNSRVNIIGIAWGKRCLACYTVINQRGEIIEKGEFNNPLKKRNFAGFPKEREEQEKNKSIREWNNLTEVKNLWKGYLSQVIHKLSKLMIQHNAIIVLEDTNIISKRTQIRVKKLVYQKLEKMLINKLNYLIIKDHLSNKTASLHQALQLTNPSFKIFRKQNGFLFYVPAYNTSNVCPATGFINLFHLNYETTDKAKAFFRKFDQIAYHPEEDLFSFKFNYKKFTNKIDGDQLEWTIWSYGDRLVNYKNKKTQQWETKHLFINSEFKKLFEKNKIPYAMGNCLKKNINNIEDKGFFVRLINLLKYTLQLQNYRINENEDWIVSPVKDQNGKFFNSRFSGDNQPKNMDANRAYHIALKGLTLLKQINQTNAITKFNPDLSNKNWCTFIQKRVFKSII